MRSRGLSVEGKATSLGRSVTMSMPKEERPSAESRVEKGMLPALRSVR